jgi:hypothetical protein
MRVVQAYEGSNGGYKRAAIGCNGAPMRVVRGSNESCKRAAMRFVIGQQ